jgi:macrolide transport system ATP-binding/permease protein
MPNWKQEIAKRLEGLRLRPEREAEIVAEVANHLQDRYDELRGEGVADEQALRDVLAELDATDLVPELRNAEEAPARDLPAEGALSTGHWYFDFPRDLRFAFRMLRKSPGFTAVAALTLALGIGANTAVFTVINTLLLNPFPIEKASEIIAVNTQGKATNQIGDLGLLSFLNLQDLRAKTHSFERLAGHFSPMAVTMTDNAEPRRVFMEVVTANYFETLGLRPYMGRFFLPEEDVTPGAAPVVVLGYTAWQGRFGGAPDILGRSIKLNNTRFTIVGVGPKGFKGLYAVFGPDLWVPSMMAEQVLPTQQQKALTDRALGVFTGIGRLKPGISMAQAGAEMKILGAALEKEFPAANEGQIIRLTPLLEAAFGPGQRQGLLLGGAMLMAIVGFVLLIACSNVANLLLARAAVRRQEIAVRMALGAGRGRLVRQLLTESVLLGLFSGALGFLFGYAGVRLLGSLRPAEYALNLAELKMNSDVFVFAFIVAILTGLIFGIVPALRSSRTSVSEALKEETRTAGRSRGRISLANTLLAGQVAVSLILLVIASLFLRNIQKEYTIDPGFQTKHLALFMLYPGQTGYDQVRTEQFYKDARQRVASLPGVSSVTWASNLPLWGRKDVGITIEGQEQRKKSEAVAAVVNTVDPDYFATLGIPMIAGRDFTQNDRDISTPVAIINDTMAATYWPNQNALGKRLQLPRAKQFLQIVGIVKTVNYESLGEPSHPCVYIPLRQNYSENMILYVRTEHDPSTTLSAIQSEIHNMDPGLPVEDIRTGTKVIDQALWWSKIGVGLLGVFGLLALGLASVGLYGVMAYSVSQRRREIGVRMALGAGQNGVLKLVLRQGMTVVASGLAVGLMLALVLGRMLSRFLYGVSGSDPLSIGGASLVLLCVAFVACYLPARSATRVDPLVTLRDA